MCPGGTGRNTSTISCLICGTGPTICFTTIPPLALELETPVRLTPSAGAPYSCTGHGAAHKAAGVGVALATTGARAVVGGSRSCVGDGRCQHVFAHRRCTGDGRCRQVFGHRHVLGHKRCVHTLRVHLRVRGREQQRACSLGSTGTPVRRLTPFPNGSDQALFPSSSCRPHRSRTRGSQDYTSHLRRFL